MSGYFEVMISGDLPEEIENPEQILLLAQKKTCYTCGKTGWLPNHQIGIVQEFAEEHNSTPRFTCSEHSRSLGQVKWTLSEQSLGIAETLGVPEEQMFNAIMRSSYQVPIILDLPNEHPFLDKLLEHWFSAFESTELIKRQDYEIILDDVNRTGKRDFLNKLLAINLEVGQE